jgi:hypothetical protein
VRFFRTVSVCHNSTSSLFAVAAKIRSAESRCVQGHKTDWRAMATVTGRTVHDGRARSSQESGLSGTCLLCQSRNNSIIDTGDRHRSVSGLVRVVSTSWGKGKRRQNLIKILVSANNLISNLPSPEIAGHHKGWGHPATRHATARLAVCRRKGWL